MRSAWLPFRECLPVSLAAVAFLSALAAMTIWMPAADASVHDRPTLTYDFSTSEYVGGGLDFGVAEADLDAEEAASAWFTDDHYVTFTQIRGGS